MIKVKVNAPEFSSSDFSVGLRPDDAKEGWEASFSPFFRTVVTGNTKTDALAALFKFMLNLNVVITELEPFKYKAELLNAD